MVLPDAPLVAGFLLGVSLAAPPGPVTALMVQASARGPWPAVAVGLGASTADMGFFFLALLGAITVLAGVPHALGGASVAGAALLAWYALGAWRAGQAAGRGEAPAAPPGVAGRWARSGFAAGFLAAATSPFNLAWWIGPGSVLLASAGVALGIGLFAGILAWMLLFCHGVARLGRRVPRFQELASYASAALLLAFALWVGWRGAQLLAGAPA